MERLSILVTFLIVLGVGCAETPELVNFSDDNSNDFVETIDISRAELAGEITQQGRDGLSSCVALAARLRVSCFHLAFNCPKGSPLSGRELLLLLSIHRK